MQLSMVTFLSMAVLAIPAVARVQESQPQKKLMRSWKTTQTTAEHSNAAGDDAAIPAVARVQEDQPQKKLMRSWKGTLGIDGAGGIAKTENLYEINSDHLGKKQTLKLVIEALHAMNTVHAVMDAGGNANVQNLDQDDINSDQLMKMQQIHDRIKKAKDFHEENANMRMTQEQYDAISRTLP